MTTPLGTFDFEKAGTMGHTRNISGAASILVSRSAIVFLFCSIGGLAPIAAAQDVKPTAPAAAKTPKAPSAKAKPDSGAPDAAAAKANPEVALKAYGSGARAFESGKMTEAVDQLTTALSAGGLPSGQMAKALYYRGAAYRKQGKPAMAISDLTSALWLKGGLSDADRALATDARQSAYREAGLGDTAPAVPVQQSAAAAPAASAPVKAAAAAPASAPLQAAAPVAAPASASAVAQAPAQAPLSSVPNSQTASSSTPSSWQPKPVAASEPIATLGYVPEPPTVRSTAASPPVPATSPETPIAVASADSPAPVANTAVLSAVEPEGAGAAPASPLANAGKSVSGFFNNMGSSIGKMFDSGGSPPAVQATQTSSSPVMTSSTGPVYASTADTNAAASGWGDRVVVAPAGGKVAQSQATSPSPAIKQTSAKGNILLQVAAVRSREEAERVSSKLQGTQAVQSAAAGTLIDEAVIGNMGTFYRVRLGPFANAAEPGKLCAVLKPEGYDCLVVSQ